MDVRRVIKALRKKYPNKNIDYSRPHYHKKLTETYKVLKGTLIVNRENKEYILEPGGTITLKPYQVHNNQGKETWIEVISHPGWHIQDHILIDESENKNK